MKTLVVDFDPESGFGTLIHPYNKRFVTYISQGIKPMTRRRYDHENKHWLVHSTRLPQAIQAGKKYFDHVDYSSLPESLQIKVVQFIEQCQKNGPVEYVYIKRRPRAMLHVTDDAPPEVIKAAYKALAILHHPDHGGDQEHFQRIQEAYEELIKK
jgi:hypothetical protein